MLSNKTLDSIFALQRLEDMVVVGSNTSSNAIEFAMAELIKKPKVMKKAHQEVDQVVGKKQHN
ncbi:hypothetical protein Pint_11142 [Pistacia integerrima]|uniref:Uncharacterized protein n=1 Tax=Pistacia integerrima TaxID=434235 RepID=A0ACC0XIS8_9ROSI|nr:hypothetical protein Pint_11142 [Pistacia integerrima]